MAGQVKPIPVPVILAAVNGDEDALAAVVAHYQKYIRALATRPVKDEYGNEYLYVDEDMRLRLETKLIHNETRALDARKASCAAPISMGRGEIPVELCQQPSVFCLFRIDLSCERGSFYARKNCCRQDRHIQ